MSVKQNQGRLRRNVIPFGAALALIIATQQQANACDGCVVSAVGAAATTITVAVGAAATAIDAAIVLADQHLTLAIAGSASAITSAITESSKNQTQTLTSVIGQNSTNRAILRAQDSLQGVDPCVQAVPAMGVANTQYTKAARAGAYAPGGPAKPTAFPGGNTPIDNVIAVAKGQVPPPSVVTQLVLSTQGACAAFATASSVRGQECQQAGLKPTDTSGLPDADVSASTLLNGPQASQDPTKRVQRDTISSDPASNDELAINAYLRNLNTPMQPQALKAGEVKTTAGQNYLALLDIYNARMSMATAADVDRAANITASTQTLPQINQLLASAQSAYVNTFLDRANPNWKKQGISYDDLMNLEVGRRYLNPQWAAALLEDGGAEVRRSIARQLALQNFLMVRLIHEVSLDRMTNAVTAASVVRQEMLPQLSKAYGLATSQ